MKTVTTRPTFQGDLMVRRIDKMPDGVKPATAENGRFILAHSETGHHHTVMERSAQLFIDEMNQFIAYLQVKEPCEIEHQRSFDTHAPVTVSPGIYEVRRQREYIAEGFRKAAD